MASATPFGTIRRIVSWVVLAGLALTLVLILKKAPPPPVATDPAAAATAERKLETAAQAAASGQPSEVRLDGVELNSYLAENLQLAGSNPNETDDAASAAPAASTPPRTAAPLANATAIDGADSQTAERAESNVKDVTIGLDGDVVKAYIVFNFHGKDLSLELDGHLYTEDGYMKFDPVGGRLGSFPLPQSALQSAVRKMMDSPENREKLRLPPDIGEIEVENGQLVVSYK